MAETVDVPGIRKPMPKWAVFGGVAVVGVLVIMYYRNKSSQAAAAAAPTSSMTPGAVPGGVGTDPFPWDGTYGNPSDPNSMDTGTGQTYGDEGAYGGGGTYGGGGGGSSSGTGGPPFTTNAAWSAYAITTMESNDPTLNTTDVQNAIGAYLAGQPLTSAQRTIVFDAIAVAGDPPVAAASGYPPKLQSAAGGGGGTGSTGGGSGGGSWAFPAPSGLHVVWKHPNGVELSWHPVTGPQGQHPHTYTVATYNSRGQLVDQFDSGSTTTKEYGRGGHGLPKGGYHTNVWANGGPRKPPHASVSYTI